jgi:hypothetical protein
MINATIIKDWAPKMMPLDISPKRSDLEWIRTMNTREKSANPIARNCRF